MKNNIPLNQILYGPPGTGKTYNTIDKALAILLENGEIESVPDNREQSKKIFDEFRAKGQIEFITFHQSFSYEDFVEGIKPETDSETNQILYKVKNGIFKDICKKAGWNIDSASESKTGINDETKRIEKIFNIYANKLKNKEDKCHYKEASVYFKNNGAYLVEDDKTREPNVPFPRICLASEFHDTRTDAVFTNHYYLTLEQTLSEYPKFREGQLSEYEVNADMVAEYDENQYLNNKEKPKQYFKKLQFKLYKELANIESDIISQEEDNIETEAQNKTSSPHILIIDEINRGNISKILGELITLIEESKRVGAKEELRAILPYSQESFGVPKNLYIIGTMNTADRSITALDSALRRRFSFVEMLPRPKLLRGKNIGQINLEMLLKAMNERIICLYDRERSIGHSYFLEVENLSDLQAVFKDKIIPLLQEYFYDDYAKIAKILNHNKMIEKVDFEFVSAQKDVYEITDFALWDEAEFIKIYEKDS